MSRRAAIIKHFLNTSRDTIALNVMQVLSEMKFEVELATDQRSDLETFWKNSGRRYPLKDYRTLLPFTLSDTFLYERFLTMMLAMKLDVDLAVDVHGDFPPYILKNGTPLVVYLLWPVSAYLRGYSYPRYAGPAGKLYLSPFALAGRALTKLVPNPFHLIAITQYVRSAIKRVSGLDSSVIYPPVDVSSFSEGLGVPKTEKDILVISRISPEKQLERAIRILQILEGKAKGWRLTIVGALSPFNSSYYERLVSLSRGHNVLIRPNLPKRAIQDAASSSSVYLHTMPGEHFGISVVEAMAAGLIPVVPNSGGPVEFVPKSLRYESEEEAADIILGTDSTPYSFRETMSHTAEGFSDACFRQNFKSYLSSIGF